MTSQAAACLLDLAPEFGESTGRGEALRDRSIGDAAHARALPGGERAARAGACFVAAVFDAFLDIFRAATADLLRIASGGTGVLPGGRLHPDLVGRVAGGGGQRRPTDSSAWWCGRSITCHSSTSHSATCLRAIVTADRDTLPGRHGYACVPPSSRRCAAAASTGRRWPPSPTTAPGLAPTGRPAPRSTATGHRPRAADPRGDPGPRPGAGGGESLRPGESVGPDDAGSTRGPAAGARSRAVGVGALRGARAGADAAVCAARHARHLPGGRGPPGPPAGASSSSPSAGRTFRTSALPAVRAATTVVAGVDGRVRYLVTKPLPDPGCRGRRRDRTGSTAMRAWAAQTEADDPAQSVDRRRGRRTADVREHARRGRGAAVTG